MSTRLAVLVAAVAVGACYAPDYHDPTCGTGGACPSGYTCSGVEGGLCVAVTDAAPADAAADAAAPVDAAPNPRRCAASTPFGDLKPVMGANGAASEWGASLSLDELTLYLSYEENGPIQVAMRATPEGAFQPPAVLTDLHGDPLVGRNPFITDNDDGSETLFLDREVGGVAFDRDFYFTKRADRNRPFDPVRSFGDRSLNTDAHETDLCFIGEEMYFLRAGVVQRSGAKSPPAPITALGDHNYSIAVSRDGLELFVAHQAGSERPDIWVARRASATAPFAAPEPVAELAHDGANVFQYPEWLSPDGCRIYFTSNRPGGKGALDLWQASRTP